MKTKNTTTNLVVSILLAGLVIALHIRLYQYAYDDAYIHFRIARNLLDNGAPYFNENEAVKVSTSSGWTVMLSVVLKIIGILKLDSLYPLTVSIVNAIFTIGGMFVYTKIVEMIKGNKLSLYSKLFFQIPTLPY